MEIVANNATVMSERQPVGNPDKFIQLFHRKTGIPDLSSVVVNFAITARLFPFWKLSVVRNNRTTNGGISQNGNNHSKQRLFQFVKQLSLKYPRKSR